MNFSRSIQTDLIIYEQVIRLSQFNKENHSFHRFRETELNPIIHRLYSLSLKIQYCPFNRTINH